MNATDIKLILKVFRDYEKKRKRIRIEFADGDETFLSSNDVISFQGDNMLLVFRSFEKPNDDGYNVFYIYHNISHIKTLTIQMGDKNKKYDDKNNKY